MLQLTWITLLHIQTVGVATMLHVLLQLLVLSVKPLQCLISQINFSNKIFIDCNFLLNPSCQLVDCL